MCCSNAVSPPCSSPPVWSGSVTPWRGCLQVLGEMLELSQGFQDSLYSTNLEVWVVILVAACLLLSVVQVLGVMGIFGQFVQPKGALTTPSDGTAFVKGLQHAAQSIRKPVLSLKFGWIGLIGHWNRGRSCCAGFGVLFPERLQQVGAVWMALFLLRSVLHFGLVCAGIQAAATQIVSPFKCPPCPLQKV